MQVVLLNMHLEEGRSYVCSCQNSRNAVESLFFFICKHAAVSAAAFQLIWPDKERKRARCLMGTKHLSAPLKPEGCFLFFWGVNERNSKDGRNIPTFITYFAFLHLHTAINRGCVW